MINMKNYYAGQMAEETVAQKYIKSGFKILGRRIRRQEGEIDIIAGYKTKLYFIEVKKAKDFQTAASRISNHQINRIKNTALRFLAETGRSLENEMRFDAALVNQIGQVKVIPNAFA